MSIVKQMSPCGQLQYTYGCKQNLSGPPPLNLKCAAMRSHLAKKQRYAHDHEGISFEKIWVLYRFCSFHIWEIEDFWCKFMCKTSTFGNKTKWTITNSLKYQSNSIKLGTSIPQTFLYTNINISHVTLGYRGHKRAHFKKKHFRHKINWAFPRPKCALCYALIFSFSTLCFFI
jgi:hypothetical protein